MKRNDTGTIFLRVILTALCLGLYAFIFANSAMTGGESASQSSSVVALVQRVFKAIAPNSFVATAQGKDYEKLHAIIRTLAHFAEFGALGALLVWCFASYTDRAVWFLVPFALILFSPIVDECIQLFTSARVADIKDLIVDTLGGCAGALFAGITLVIGVAVKRKKEGNNGKKGIRNCPYQIQQKNLV